jgi:hypothetical protein
MAAVILLLGVFLAATGGSLTRRWQYSMARHQSLAFEDLIGITANVLGLVLVAWWVISLLLAFIAATYELRGRNRAATIVGRISPAFMRRLALAAVGLQLMTAPLANAAPPDPLSGQHQEAAVSAAWTPSDINSDASESGRTVTHEPLKEALIPAPAVTGEAYAFEPSRPEPRWQPSPPAVAAGPLARIPLRTVHQQSEISRNPVTVMSGDSLWTIASRHLGPLAADVEIAREWPRWYQANEGVIGENPNVLLPGQILTPPAVA